MREVINTGIIPVQDILWAFVLSGVYVLIAVLFFSWNFKIVKAKGLLVGIGE